MRTLQQTKSKREKVYQIDEITYPKAGGTLNAYMRAKQRVREGKAVYLSFH